jgi:hypothetical protein
MSMDRPQFLMRLADFARSGDACVEASKDMEATLNLVEELFDESQRLSAQNRRLRETISAVGRCRDITQANADRRDAQQRITIASLNAQMQELHISYQNLLEEYHNLHRLYDAILLELLELKKQ